MQCMRDIQCELPSVRCCRVFHHHMTTVVGNLIAGIKARGPSVPVDIANVTQASPAAWL